MAGVLGRRRVAAEESMEIIRLYEAGATVREISTGLSTRNPIGINPATVYNVLNRAGVTVRSPHKSLSLEEEAHAIQMYRGGMTAKAVASVFGVYEMTLIRAMQRRGVTTRDPATARRKYPLREDAFDDLSDECAAYWAGFIAADGCVYGRTLSICLQDRDRAHLENLQTWLGTTKPIETPKDVRRGRAHCRLTVHSRRLVQALAQCGIVERKSLVLARRPDLSEGATCAFYRGYFDGDGHIGVHGKHTIFHLCGTHDFLIEFQNWLNDRIGIPRTCIRKPNAIHSIQKGGTAQVAAIAHLLYRGAAVYLPRKKVVADTIIATAIQRPLAVRRYPILAALTTVLSMSGML